jgi:hypothetical protein
MWPASEAVAARPEFSFAINLRARSISYAQYTSFSRLFRVGTHCVHFSPTVAMALTIKQRRAGQGGAKAADRFEFPEDQL